jgi:L-serine/L-threonine ammonia-lyase
VIVEGKLLNKSAYYLRFRILVPAYDEPLLWEGHSSMIAEVKNQLDVKPDAIFCSVGGGGLLGGIIVGCKNENWDDGKREKLSFLASLTYPPLVPIIGLETIGSDCFHHSLSLNRTPGHVDEKKLPPGVDVIHDKENDLYLAHFNSFSSKASSSLGASQPSVGMMKWH